MAIVGFWLFLIFFVGSLAIIWWTLLVDHDLTEEPYEEEDKKDDNPFAGQDGVSLVSNVLFSLPMSMLPCFTAEHCYTGGATCGRLTGIV